MLISKNLVVLASLFVLSACSGGSSSSSTVPNRAPSVNAGADATIRLPVVTVSLDGTVSDDGQPAGAAVSTAWIVQSGPAGASFANVNAVDTTVTFVSEGTYVLQLTADDTALQGSDTVTIIVEADPAPVADAGGPYTGVEGAAVALDGSASTDANNDIVLYEWDLDNDGAYDDATGVNTAFNVFSSGVFTIGLRVTDGDGVTDSDTTTVTLMNLAPTANAQAVSTNENIALPITLTGSDPGSDPLTFAIGSGPSNGTLSGTAPDITYTPNTNYRGLDSFTFTVNDGEFDSAVATVSITVSAAAAVHSFWKFGEGSGLTTADAVGNSDGSVVGAIWTAGATGNALEFNGTSDHVVIDNTPELSITGTKISLVAWIKPGDGGKTGGSRIISKRTDAPGSDVYAMYTDQYRLHFRLDGQDMISSYIIVLNDWVHVAMVYDGIDKRIYVNGVLDLATPQAKTDLIDTSTRAVHIGKREGDAQFFKGAIDEVQIFNRALSAAEVSTMFAGVIPPNPVAGSFHPFIDITATAGTAGPADGGHGLMFADVNNDSFPDLYLTTNNTDGIPRGDFFFRNNNGNTFSEEGAARGISDFDGGSHGAVWADLNNDGSFDLFNGSTWTAANPSAGNPVNNNVYANNGAGNFSEQTSADILATATETRGVTAFDMDGDGALDLFGVSGPATPGVSEAYLNPNDGSLGFTSHVGGQLTTAIAMEGVVDTDYDGDGDIDVLAADSSGGRLAILQNDGFGNFTRIDAASIGINRSAFHGVTSADVDNDGDLDLLLVTDGTGHLFLRDSGSGNYVFRQTFGNVEGYMGGFADLDNDGDQDLVFAGDERVFLNKDNATAIFQSAQSVPVSEIADPRAIAFADIDNDGDVDFAISAKQSRNWLVRNRGIEEDPAGFGNWLKVKLVSPQCQAGAFGAKLRIYPAGDGFLTLLGMREAQGNNGYLAQNDPVIHFGLGNAASVDVVVEWADSFTPDTIVLGALANTSILIDACP